MSVDDDAGIAAVAAHLPSRYAETETLARIAERLGKAKVSELLRNKLPATQSARSGDLGEILATAYLEEDCGYVVGPSRLIHRDHHEWAMRGDDALGAKFDSASNVVLIKGEAKSRARAAASVVEEAREGLQREDGLPSTHSLTQFAERLLSTVDADLGEAIIKLQLECGVRPGNVTHLMFLFAGNDPSSHVRANLATYGGLIAQQAVILRVQAHQDFVRTAFEKVIADGA
ncbi:Hachiman antiphage defense system protein HamA [Saccharopolyspora sp. 5N102]|uniref:Hachiman antiphage defense system protein HamA n=1 Tax=Saccharopolyspora sp. 5N102 TaxID=3375155 RepID=UPI00379ADA44